MKCTIFLKKMFTYGSYSNHKANENTSATFFYIRPKYVHGLRNVEFKTWKKSLAIYSEYLTSK